MHGSQQADRVVENLTVQPALQLMQTHTIITTTATTTTTTTTTTTGHSFNLSPQSPSHKNERNIVTLLQIARLLQMADAPAAVMSK